MLFSSGDPLVSWFGFLAEEASQPEAASAAGRVSGPDVAKVEGVVVPDSRADDALRLSVLDGEAGVDAGADLAVLALWILEIGMKFHLRRTT